MKSEQMLDRLLNTVQTSTIMLYGMSKILPLQHGLLPLVSSSMTSVWSGISYQLAGKDMTCDDVERDAVLAALSG